MLGPLLLGKMLFIAFTSPAESWWRDRFAEQGDADREWWARWTGWTLISIVVWIGASSLVFFAPFLLREGVAQAGAVLAAGGFGALATIASGTRTRSFPPERRRAGRAGRYRPHPGGETT